MNEWAREYETKTWREKGEEKRKILLSVITRHIEAYV